MNKCKKYIAFLLCLCMAFSLTGCNVPDVLSGKTKIVLTTGFDKDAVFQIGTSTCYYDEFMVYLTNTQNRYESVYGGDIWNISSGDVTLEQKIKDSVAFKIAQVKTLNLLATQYGVYLSEEELRKVDEITDLYVSSLTANEMEQLHVSRELIHQMYEEYALAHVVYAYIIRDINPEISDDEARTVSVEWIHFNSIDGDYKVQNNAQNVWTRIQNGEDFEILAETFSDDVLTTHAISKNYSDPAIRAVAFELGEGEVSNVVTGIDGFYILRCVSTLDRAQTDENKLKIVEERKNEAFNEVYETFAQEQIKKLYDDVWDSITLIHDENITTHTFFELYDQYFTE